MLPLYDHVIANDECYELCPALVPKAVLIFGMHFARTLLWNPCDLCGSISVSHFWWREHRAHNDNSDAIDDMQTRRTVVGGGCRIGCTKGRARFCRKIDSKLGWRRRSPHAFHRTAHECAGVSYRPLSSDIGICVFEPGTNGCGECRRCGGGTARMSLFLYCFIP